MLLLFPFVSWVHLPVDTNCEIKLSHKRISLVSIIPNDHVFPEKHKKIRKEFLLSSKSTLEMKFDPKDGIEIERSQISEEGESIVLDHRKYEKVNNIRMITNGKIIEERRKGAR